MGSSRGHGGGKGNEMAGATKITAWFPDRHSHSQSGGGTENALRDLEKTHQNGASGRAYNVRIWKVAKVRYGRGRDALRICQAVGIEDVMGGGVHRVGHCAMICTLYQITIN